MITGDLIVLSDHHENAVPELFKNPLSNEIYMYFALPNKGS